MKPADELAKETAELARLMQVREDVEIAIARCKRRIAAWNELIDDSETGELIVEVDLGGLSEAARTVLRASRKEWMTVAEIQEALREIRFPLCDYKAPTASITTTVNRLVDSGEVLIEKRPNGANEYKWAGAVRLIDAVRNYGAPNSLANQFARERENLTSTRKRKGLGQLMVEAHRRAQEKKK